MKNYYKFIFSLILILTFSTLQSKVIYNKNNLVITEFEINSFIKIYKKIYQLEISYNEALKRYIIINDLILSLNEVNENYIRDLDSLLIANYGENIKYDNIEFNILRYRQIRNEFLFEYFKNNFTENDLNSILLKLDNLAMPYSSNNCITIDGVIEYKSYEGLNKILYDRIKNNTNDLKITLGGEKYEICLNQNLLNIIDNQIYIFLEQKTKNKFEIFVYDKVKKRFN